MILKKGPHNDIVNEVCKYLEKAGTGKLITQQDADLLLTERDLLFHEGVGSLGGKLQLEVIIVAQDTLPWPPIGQKFVQLPIE